MSLLIDSSGWIEHFINGPKASSYSKFILGKEEIVIPTLVLFEVYRKIKKMSQEEDAIFAVTQMQRCQIVPLDDELALFAADLSLQHKLGMADSIVYATVLSAKARLVTSDNDFRNLPDVILI